MKLALLIPLTIALINCDASVNTPVEKQLPAGDNIITDAIPNKRTIAIDWVINVKLKNESSQAQWFIISDSFDDDSLSQGINASGYTYYLSQGLSKAPITNIFGDPSLEILFIPAGASVQLQNLKIRKNDTKLANQVTLWQASDIIVGKQSIHGSWLLGLNPHTPPKNVKLDINKRIQIKEMTNKDYKSEKITFEDLQKSVIKLELGGIELPEFIQK